LGLRGGLTDQDPCACGRLGQSNQAYSNGGHVHDVRAAGQLLEGVACGALLGDKATMQTPSDARIAIVIPPKSNRKDKGNATSFSTKNAT
jgi:hypothetical protein